MSKRPQVLRELHRAETSLARDLLKLANRHRPEQEIHYAALDIATWSMRHVTQIAQVGREHGIRLNPRPRWARPWDGLTSRLSTHLAARPETGPPLLADLRRVHRKAAGVSLDWELLAQAAQAMRLADLLELTQSCHPDTLRQMRWANAHLKITSSQIIAS